MGTSIAAVRPLDPAFGASPQPWPDRDTPCPVGRARSSAPARPQAGLRAPSSLPRPPMDTKRRRFRLAVALGLAFLLIKVLYSRRSGETRVEPEHWTMARERVPVAPAAGQAREPPARAAVVEQATGWEAGSGPEVGGLGKKESKWKRPISDVISLTSNAWPPPRDGFREDARYLTYLAHSGFHNQRSVSLEVRRYSEG